MTQDRWHEIKRLFDAALEREPATRPAFIRDACQGDAALQQELESLLANHDRQGRTSDVLRLRGFENGSRLGPYTILSPIGSGGMGDVYKARDTRLNRTVAIKVINPSVAENSEVLMRFELEARAAASLNHPHICTLHDVGIDQGVSFFVMEYLEGQTLAERLSASGLPLDQALRHAIEIAEALEAAHAHGITHRDLKPANIMLTERGAKLLDFGLAKLAPAAESDAKDGSGLTALGCAPGTLHYMAPEQLAAEHTDIRSDVYAFGAVLYEMVTGRRAFDGVRPIAPAALDALVRRCLERDRDLRWPSCAPILAELRLIAAETQGTRLPARFRRAAIGLAAAVALLLAGANAYWQGPRGTVPDAIAVLPFVNATADPELEYLSEGITDGLINSLSRIPNLRVAPRTLVSSFGGRTDVQAIARSLDVQAVVSGRITGRNDSVTVAVELIDVQKLAQMWGAQYRGSLRDMLSVEKAIAGELAGRLQPEAGRAQAEEVTSRYADNPEAYQAYLRGRYYLRMQTRDGYTKSVEYFEEALRKDPSYALAYAGLSDAMMASGYFQMLPPVDAYPRAKTAALRALELDDQLAEAYAALGSAMLLYEWNFAGAAENYERAIALNPRSSIAHHCYSVYLSARGRLTEAITAATRAEQLDPISPTQVAHTGWIHYLARQYDRAIEQAQRSLELQPGFASAYELIAYAVLAKGLGVEEFRQLLGRHQEMPSAQAQFALIDAVRGSSRDKQLYLASLRSDEAQHGPVRMAVINGMLDRPAEALDWLEKAYATRQGQLIWMDVSPTFDNIRSHPGFVALSRRIGLQR